MYGTLRTDERLRALREQAKGRRDPATEDDTLQLLLLVAQMRAPRRILEIGTAEGLTSVALLLQCVESRHLSDIHKILTKNSELAPREKWERIKHVLHDVNTTHTR